MLIESLEELREKGASGDASARKMCDLLDATREAIQTTKQSGEEPSATEYFSTLLTTLDARGSAMAIEIFSLLAVILPHTPDALVRSQLGKLFAAISAVLKNPTLVKEQVVIQSVAIISGWVLLRVPCHGDDLQRPEPMRLLEFLQDLLTDSRQPIRSAAQRALLRVLRHHSEMKTVALSSRLGSSLSGLLKTSSGKDTTRLLQIMEFLRRSLSLFPAKVISSVCEGLLRLTSFQTPKLTATAFRVIQCMLDAPEARVNLKFLTRLVPAAAIARLLKEEAVEAEAEGRTLGHGLASTTHLPTFFMTVVECLESSHAAVHASASAALGRMVQEGIHEPFLQDAVTVMENGATLEDGRRGRSGLERVAIAFESLTEYRFQHCWSIALPVVAAFMNRLGQLIASMEDSAAREARGAPATSHEEEQRRVLEGISAARTTGERVRDVVERATSRLLLSLVEIRDRIVNRRGPAVAAEAETAKPKKRRARQWDDSSSDEEPQESEAVHSAAKTLRAVLLCIGSCVEPLGIPRFLRLVPLDTRSETQGGVQQQQGDMEVEEEKAETDGVSDERLWLFPLLRERVKTSRSQLQYFAGPLLDAARVCETRAKLAMSASKSGLAKSLRARGMQIWSLFPGFCVAPTDLSEAFTPELGKLLCRGMTDKRYPQLMHFICGGINTLIERNRLAAEGDYDSDDDDESDAGSVGAFTTGTGTTMYTGSRFTRSRAGDAAMESKSTMSGRSRSSRSTRNRRRSKGARSVASSNGFGIGNTDPALAALIRGPGLPIITQAEGQLNLELIKRYAKNFIPVLFNAYEGATSSTSEQYAATVHNAAAAYLGIAPVALVTQYFGRLESLLTQSLAGLAQATAASGKWTTEQKEAVEAERVKASSRLGLALAITPRLEPPALASLYRIIRPAIQDDTHSSVQKRAYKVLLAIVMANPQFALAPERRDDILGLLRDSLVTVSPSAKSPRLLCLAEVVKALDMTDSAHVALLPSLVGEVMLCAQDRGKARQGAFRVLVAIGRKMRDAPNPNGPPDGSGRLMEFISMMLAGLQAANPKMKAAAVVSLARIVYEFRKAEPLRRVLERLLHTVLLFLKTGEHSVCKAVTGFVKVVAQCLPAEELQPYLKDILSALFTWPGPAKSKIRRKLRSVLEKFLFKFSAETLAEGLPKEDLPLLQYVDKRKRRRTRKKAAEGASAISTSSLLDGIDGGDDESDEEDAGVKAAVASAATGETAGAWIKSGFSSEPLDFLDPTATAEAVGTDAALMARKRKSKKARELGEAAMAAANAGPDLKFSSEGKIMIYEMEDEDLEKSSDDDSDMEGEKKAEASKIKAKQTPSKLEKRGKAQPPAKGGKEGKYSGKAYRSKKAGGDVMRKDQKYEPFAYVPLDPRSMSSKGGATHTGRFAGVMESTRKGKKSNKRRKM